MNIYCTVISKDHRLGSVVFLSPCAYFATLKNRVSYNYDIIKDGILSADPSTTGGKKVTKMPSTTSIAWLLGGVKDKNGNLCYNSDSE